MASGPFPTRVRAPLPLPPPELGLASRAGADPPPPVLDHRPLIQVQWQRRLGEPIRFLANSQKFISRANSPGLKQTARPRPAWLAVRPEHLPFRVSAVLLEVAAVALHSHGAIDVFEVV